MKPILKTLWQRRWVRGTAYTIFTAATLVVLLFTTINWLGQRRLSAVEEMLTREGETLDMRQNFRDPVPESQNFCAIPALKDLASTTQPEAAEKRKRFEGCALPKKDGRPRMASVGHGRPIDLKAMADWLLKAQDPQVASTGDPAKDILLMFSRHEPLFAELAAGLDRPFAQFTPEWKTADLPENLFSISFPHFSSGQAVCETLALRGAAAAEVDPAKAHQSLQLILRFAEASAKDPMLIGSLVAMSQRAVANNLLWTLCAAHAGSAEDFTRTERAFAAYDGRETFLRALRSEMIGVHQISPDALSAAEMNGNPLETTFRRLRMLPRGWLAFNVAELLEMHFDRVKALRDEGFLQIIQQEERNIARLGSASDGDRGLGLLFSSRFLASMAYPVVSTCAGNALYSEALSSQAIIACVLERYRIENGSYPASLSGLTTWEGKPLPLDPITGKEMGYRKTENGRYALWSAGFDCKDDGGKRNLDSKNPDTIRFHKKEYIGDWVWDFPGQ